MRTVRACLTALILSASASLAGATTLVVDGPGDGDSSGGDEFDSVGAALNSLGPLGIDGASDEILVTVPEVIEPIPLRLNGGTASAEGFAPVRDDLTVRGLEGMPTLHSTHPVHGSDHFEIWLADGQAVRLESLALAQANLPTVILLVRAADASTPLEASALSLERVDIESPYSNLDAWPLWAFVLTPLPKDSSLTLAVSDCRIGGDIWGGMKIAASWVSGEITGCDLSSRMSAIVPPFQDSGNGATFSFAGPGRLRLSDVRVASGELAALSVDFASREAEGAAELIIGPGCEFLDTGDGIVASMHGGSEDRLLLSGDRQDPVVIDGSDGIGIDVDCQRGQFAAEHAIISQSGGPGLSLRSLTSLSSPALHRCLLTRNGRLADEPVNVVVRSDPGPATEVLFDSCTIHNILKTTVDQDPSTLVAPTEFDLRNQGTRSLTVRLRNTIVSGDTGEDTFNMTGSANTQVLLERSALVFQGPHALGHPNYTGQGSILIQGLIISDPAFGPTGLPVGELSFDVFSAFYGTAGPGGGPLTGYGDYMAPYANQLGLSLR